ncbi:MAG: DUF6876 family protein [Planctomycetota bacterium]
MGTLTKNDLIQFSGDLVRYQHPHDPKVIYTPGVRYVAKNGKAYWLIEAIASWLGGQDYLQATTLDERLCYRMYWQLTVSEDRSAVLEARADSDAKPWASQTIRHTDFPLPSLEIWAAIEGEQWTLSLPSEH